ncbi:MAG: Hpt domain-containing protein [Bdellovibrionales bacterium]|nr:Hpt domain-containing protein [Bdellovibrionales bacterium]
MEVPNDIMGRYIERRKRDLEACISSLHNQKFDEIEKVGHQLKGNGTTFGHPELSLIGKKMELAAQGHDIETLETSLEEFSKWVSSLH